MIHRNSLYGFCWVIIGLSIGGFANWQLANADSPHTYTSANENPVAGSLTIQSRTFLFSHVLVFEEVTEAKNALDAKNPKAVVSALLTQKEIPKRDFLAFLNANSNADGFSIPGTYLKVSFDKDGKLAGCAYRATSRGSDGTTSTDSSSGPVTEADQNRVIGKMTFGSGSRSVSVADQNTVKEKYAPPISHVSCKVDYRLWDNADSDSFRVHFDTDERLTGKKVEIEKAKLVEKDRRESEDPSLKRQGFVDGEILFKGKTYRITNVVAYETNSLATQSVYDQTSENPVGKKDLGTCVLFCCEFIPVEELRKSLRKDGEVDLFRVMKLETPYFEFYFDRNGGPNSYRFSSHTKGDSHSSQGSDVALLGRFTIEDGAAIGACSYRSYDKSDGTLAFHAKFKADLVFRFTGSR